LNAQVSQEWVRLYPDNDPSFSADANASVLDSSGNIYITGSAGSSSFSAYCTVKYSNIGVLQWSQLYKGSNYGGRQTNDIAIDKFGNIYVTGRSNNPENNWNWCTIKYDLNGNMQWVSNYDGPVHGYDEAQAIATDNTGNIYVLGRITLAGGGETYGLVKYSNDGRELWARSYPITTSVIYKQGIKIDDSCNVYITNDYGIAVTAKYDSSGNRLWLARFSGWGETGSNSVTIDSFHNVYIAGYTHRFPTGTHMFILKYNASGNQEWVRTYNTDTNSTSSYYEACTIALDKFRNIYVNGYYTQNRNIGGEKFCTLKYTDSGDLVWVQKDSARVILKPCMVLDRNSNIYITGSTPAVEPYHAIIIIKYDSSGSQQWRARYYVTGDSHPSDLDVNSNYDVYLSGSSNTRMCTIKYTQTPIGIINENTITPINFALLQNYPNPFNSETIIKFQIPNLSKCKLSVYDIRGKEIDLLLNEKLKPGIYEYKFNGRNLSSGIYFYKMITNEYNETRRMVLIK
jgi:hypothetical protein